MRHDVSPIQLLSKRVHHEIKIVSSVPIMELRVVCVVIDPIDIGKQHEIVHLQHIGSVNKQRLQEANSGQTTHSERAEWPFRSGGTCCSSRD